MSGHQHADLMAKAAEIAKTDKEWHRHFQFKTDKCSDWRDMSCDFLFYEHVEYRLKPRYIDINGHQVPEPVRESVTGDILYIADTTLKPGGNLRLQWTGHDVDMRLLNSGLLHTTKEAAEAHIAALLSFTQK